MSGEAKLENQNFNFLVFHFVDQNLMRTCGTLIVPNCWCNFVNSNLYIGLWIKVNFYATEFENCWRRDDRQMLSFAIDFHVPFFPVSSVLYKYVIDKSAMVYPITYRRIVTNSPIKYMWFSFRSNAHGIFKVKEARDINQRIVGNQWLSEYKIKYNSTNLGNTNNYNKIFVLFDSSAKLRPTPRPPDPPSPIFY